MAFFDDQLNTTQNDLERVKSDIATLRGSLEAKVAEERQRLQNQIDELEREVNEDQEKLDEAKKSSGSNNSNWTGPFGF